MAEAPLLLSRLLDSTRRAVDEAIEASAANGRGAGMVEKAMATLGDAVDNKVREACNCDVVALLVEGWSNASEIRDYSNTKKHPPPTKSEVFLGKHPMKITIDPQLTIVAGRTFRLPLNLFVDFYVTVNSARLTIIDGEIDAVDIGTLTFDAKLRWADTEIPINLKERVIPLPGHFVFNPRFKIP